MTFAIAFASPQFAILCTDTRINTVEDGIIVAKNDFGHENFKVGNKVIKVEDMGRKLRRFPGGWVGGSGQFGLVTECLDALQKSKAKMPVEVKRVIRHTYEEYKLTQGYSDSDIKDTFILYIYHNNESLMWGHFDIKKNTSVESECNACLACSNNISDEQAKDISDRLAVELISRRPYDAIRYISQIFHEVHRIDESVSDFIDCAIVVKEGKGAFSSKRLHSSNEFVEQASNIQIDKLIKNTP